MDNLQCLDVSLTHYPQRKGLLLHEISLNFVVCDDHNPCIPCILAVLAPSLTTKLNLLSTSNMILDTIFTAKQPCPRHQHKNILVRQFSVPDQITATSYHDHHITSSERLRMYSTTLPHTHLNSTLQSHAINDILDEYGLNHLQNQESKHKLLFIEFTPVSTLRLHEYFIQVDLDSNLDMYPSTPPNGTYYCVFLAKYPNDIHKSD